MIRQTGLAQIIDVVGNEVKYDACAKKLLSYKAIIAWILKTCTKEFSEYSISYICDNCLREEAEISKYALHQDEFNIAMTVELEREVREMCNLSKALVEQGIELGIEHGKIQTLIELVKEGTLPVMKAAAKANMTEEQFTEEMNKQRAGEN